MWTGEALVHAGRVGEIVVFGGPEESTAIDGGGHGPGAECRAKTTAITPAGWLKLPRDLPLPRDVSVGRERGGGGRVVEPSRTRSLEVRCS